MATMDADMMRHHIRHDAVDTSGRLGPFLRGHGIYDIGFQTIQGGREWKTRTTNHPRWLCAGRRASARPPRPGRAPGALQRVRPGGRHGSMVHTELGRNVMTSRETTRRHLFAAMGNREIEIARPLLDHGVHPPGFLPGEGSPGLLPLHKGPDLRIRLPSFPFDPHRGSVGAVLGIGVLCNVPPHEDKGAAHGGLPRRAGPRSIPPMSMCLRGYPWGPRTPRMEPEDYPRAFQSWYGGNWIEVDIMIFIIVGINY